MSGLGDLDGLVARATELAAAWGVSAAAATTAGRERSILRLFGVNGVDRTGRPLAAEVVNRWLAPDGRRLGGGIALPFAVALVEYDLAPQELALEVAAGGIDLGFEAELLNERDRRSVAEAEAARLAGFALDRIDANRTARRELVDLLGESPAPWVGTSLTEPSVGDAVDEAIAAITAGADLVRADVPIGSELADRLAGAGLEVPRWRARADAGGRTRGDDEGAPTGSQRGLATLRGAVDEAAAERGSYVRLATATPALAAPEQAVVAGFERIDVVLSDAMTEIVATGVDPDRALADHALAHAIVARAGATLLIGAGPLAVGPDLATGVPSDPATRAGRALALQLLGVHLAIRDGIDPAQIVVDVLPSWVTAEPVAAARALAEVVVRRALMPEHPTALVEPGEDAVDHERWFAIVAALMPHARSTRLVMRRPGTAFARRVRAVRSAAGVASEIAGAQGDVVLDGVALSHARATIEVAIRTLDALGSEGWRAVLGSAMVPTGASRLGADAVVERAEGADPFGALLAPDGERPTAAEISRR